MNGQVMLCFGIFLSLAMLRKEIQGFRLKPLHRFGQLDMFACNILDFSSLAILRREIPQPTDQHHPTRQSGREASIEIQTWEDKEDHCLLKGQESLAEKSSKKGMLKVLAYCNIDAETDESVIGVRLQRPPGKRVTLFRPRWAPT